MMAPCSSGHCVMPADQRPRSAFAQRLLLVLLLSCLSALGVAAEAPFPEMGSNLPPLPPEAEAAHQDLRNDPGSSHTATGKALDEAIFTEISPLTIPEVGVALPADQEH